MRQVLLRVDQQLAHLASGEGWARRLPVRHRIPSDRPFQAADSQTSQQSRSLPRLSLRLPPRRQRLLLPDLLRHLNRFSSARLRISRQSSVHRRSLLHYVKLLVSRIIDVTINVRLIVLRSIAVSPPGTPSSTSGSPAKQASPPRSATRTAGFMKDILGDTRDSRVSYLAAG